MRMYSNNFFSAPVPKHRHRCRRSPPLGIATVGSQLRCSWIPISSQSKSSPLAAATSRPWAVTIGPNSNRDQTVPTSAGFRRWAIVLILILGRSAARSTTRKILYILSHARVAHRAVRIISNLPPVWYPARLICAWSCMTCDPPSVSPTHDARSTRTRCPSHDSPCWHRQCPSRGVPIRSAL